MKFKSLMQKINPNTKIEIYYEDNEYVNQGTAKSIKRMYAWEWFLKNKEVESIEIEKKALIIIIKKD